MSNSNKINPYTNGTSNPNTGDPASNKKTLILRVRSPGGQPPTEEKKPVNITPTFLLRGIDPSSILQAYLQGKYEDKPIPGSKVEAVANVIAADSVVGENSESEIYEYIDRTNTQRRIITSNHKKYAIVRDSNQFQSDIPPGGICQWCRRVFNHEPVGIPVRMEYLSKENISIYHVEGVFCVYEELLMMIKLKTHCPMILQESLFKDSETMLRTMFDTVYPGEYLGDCSDWTLLECNGGPISEKDFFSKLHVYRRSPNIILQPLKVEYTVDPIPVSKSTH